ncbi:MAG: hypothetical protein ABJG41_12695 [Cyclobacteriaceae bacterium]
MEREEVLMTDDEFNVLDELYFVQSFGDLVELSEYQASELIPILIALNEKGYIKFLKDVDEEWGTTTLKHDQFLNSYFLATKKGLLAHNS